MLQHYKLLTTFFALIISNMIFAQSITVSGTVTAKGDNSPLSGVTISITGNDKGFKTDDAGKFTITAQKNNVAVFSFVGYQSQRVTLNSPDNPLNIVLENADNSL